MEFNNTTTQDSICSEIDRICGTTDVTYPLKAKTARANQALDHFFSIALLWDKSWSFDDVNNPDLNIAVTNLVSGQQDYAFADELLMVKNGVFIKDLSGVYRKLEEETDPENTFLVPSANAGMPTKFRLTGGSILLDFIPNYNSTAGLKVPFSRNASKFVSTDTTKIPGIPSLFHPWLCQWASLPFLIEHRLPQKNDIEGLIFKGEQDIKNFMANRNQTRQPRLTPVQQDNR